MGVIPSSQLVAGVYYEKDLYSCRFCPDKLMTMTVSSSGIVSCSCPSGYTKVGQSSIGSQSCVKTTNEYLSTATSAATVEFASETIVSAVILHHYTLAATRCKYFGGPDDQASCQTLANLCVLQQYNALSYPCSVFQEISNLRSSIENIATWPQSMPWLYYRTPSTPCKDTSLQMTMSLNSLQLEFIVATYTLNGTFLGYSDVETLFTYCPMPSPWTQTGGGSSSTTLWMIFGSSQYISFKCDPGLLVDRSQLFYELFLKDTVTGLLMPISVRITNLLDSSGKRPNSKFISRDLCKSNEIHVRRFYLFDISTGITETSPDSPVALRFAEYIRLDIRITESDPESIYTPVLTLQYKDTTIDSTTETPADAQAPFTSYTAASNPTVTFEVIYSMNSKTFFTTLNGFFIAGIVVAILVFLSKYFNWRTRNLRTVVGPSAMATNGITLTLLIELTSLACHSWVLVFFPFLLLVSWYWFVFFKLQDTVAVMLPPMHNIYSTESEYNSFVMLLHLLFFCQLFHIAHLVYRQASVDLFFIDWEPARKENKSVSVWRTILVANEWNEMQIIRRTDLSLTLLALGFFLLGLKLENNATQQPELSNLQDGKLNILLRFANTSWFWLVMTTAQLLWKYLIYERYITEPKEQIFIDMCTIAKVSVIVLDEPYHGYYLHCRSPHQYADGNMAELVSMLHKEEVGLTVDRTLDGANSDAQCYEIFLTGDWRLRFDKASGGLMDYDPITNVLESIMSVTQPRRRLGQGGAGGIDRGGGSWAHSRNGMSTDRMMKCWTDLNSFLQAFIENNFSMPDLKRVFREQTYVEKVFGTPPDLMAPGQSCVFYPDENYSYVKVHLLGREVDMIIFDILVYSIFDLWLGSTAISMLLCYLVDSFISRLREELGQVPSSLSLCLSLFATHFPSLSLCLSLSRSSAEHDREEDAGGRKILELVVSSFVLPIP
jgi:meckelin